MPRLSEPPAGPPVVAVDAIALSREIQGMNPEWGLLLVPLLILLNAFFVAAEYALVASRGTHVDALRKTGRSAAADALERLRRNPGSAIAAIQVCITMTNLLLGWIGEPAMTAVLVKALGPFARLIPRTVFELGSITIAFLGITLLTVVFSELLPKALTLRYVTPVAAFTAVPVTWVLSATKALVWTMNAMANLVTRPLGLGTVDQAERDWHTAEELRTLVDDSAEHGVLTTRERSLVLNSLSLGRRTAREIVIPRVRVQYLDIQWSMDRNRQVIDEYLHSYLPLCDGGMDKLMGIISTREFLTAFYAEGDSSVLQLLARPAVFAPDSLALDRLLLLFDEKKTHMVLLVDEHGTLEGIVTLRDVLDELVGEPLDLANRGPGRLIVEGELPLRELAGRIGVDELGRDAESVTVAGLVAELLGRIPMAGDEVRHCDVLLRVLEADVRVARRIDVSRVPPLPKSAK